MNRIALLSLLLLAAALAAPRPVLAQAQAGPGYGLRVLDGVNRLGPHFALLPRPHADNALGLVYFEDEGALYGGNCYGQCTLGVRLTNGADRGRHVSAALRPALNNRAFAAFYNADSGDLEAIDCLDTDCGFASLRVLETTGDVGAGTATVVDPATGLPQVAYYDVGNGDLRLYRCTTAICDAGGSVLVDGNGDSGRAPTARFAGGRLLIAYQRDADVWLASAGAPYTSFERVRVAAGSAPVLLEWGGAIELLFTGVDGSLQRRRCDANCAQLSDPGALSAAAGSGIAPSATLLSDGRLFLTRQLAASGDLIGQLCADPACASPQTFLLQPGADTGFRSQAMGYSDGRPLAYFDGIDHSLRSSRCTSAACVATARQVASNGVVARSPRLALRSDGRAVAIWTRLRTPRMALCSDAECSSVSIREPQAANSDGSEPSIAIRPDGRPFAFYSYVGGNAGWDCADPDCSSGTLRPVASAGTGTGQHTELVIRADGRPLLAYTRIQGAVREVRVFSCADVNCSSGSEHLVADESAVSTSISGLNIALGSDGRALLAWNRSQGSEGSLRLAHCADVDCSSASLRSLNASLTYYRVPLAVRGDGRPVLLEALSSGRNLLICDTPACLSLARAPLPNLFEIPGSLALDAAQRPIYSVGTIGLGGFWQCADPACSSAERSIAVSDGGAPNRGFSGPLALHPKGRPVMVFGEQDLGDVWLLTPRAGPIFANGFED